MLQNTVDDAGIGDKRDDAHAAAAGARKRLETRGPILLKTDTVIPAAGFVTSEARIFHAFLNQLCEQIVLVMEADSW
jgi:hypothetical protein